MEKYSLYNHFSLRNSNLKPFFFFRKRNHGPLTFLLIIKHKFKKVYIFSKCRTRRQRFAVRVCFFIRKISAFVYHLPSGQCFEITRRNWRCHFQEQNFNSTKRWTSQYGSRNEKTILFRLFFKVKSIYFRYIFCFNYQGTLPTLHYFLFWRTIF